MSAFRNVAAAETDIRRHAWMSYMVDKAPSQDPLLQRQVREWEPKEHRPTLTWSRSGYRPYSTYVLFLITVIARANDAQRQAQVRSLGAGGEGSTVDHALSTFLVIHVHIHNAIQSFARVGNLIIFVLYAGRCA